MKKEIVPVIEKAVKNLQEKKKLPRFKIPEVLVFLPANEAHGDYSSNIALQLSDLTKEPPFLIAEKIKEEIEREKHPFLKKVEAVKPGFLNFFLSKEVLQNVLKNIPKVENVGKGKKVNLEFISANPTGPLTLGNGRGGFWGDALGNVLEKTGFKVTREYYINDDGTQIRALGYSVLDGSEAVYKGEYIKKLKKKIKEKDPKKAGQKAAKEIMKDMIKPTVKKAGIEFDVWFSEKSLDKDKTLNNLKKKKLVFEKEGALWFKAKEFGDDKDRVLIRADGEPTYFLSDIAYLEDKFKRGFEKLIFLWGTDHHGYVKRMEAAAKALGFSKEQADFVIFQLVRLLRWGKVVRMSKRRGVYITLDELINEVGIDVARFFFLERALGTHLNFDLDLAKEKSENNPVYYVQYAHARIASILKKFKGEKGKGDFSLLAHPSELGLLKQILRFPEVIEETAKDYQLQRLPQYSKELALSFHKFYKDCRVLSKDERLMEARLSLIKTAKTVLGDTLELMGISAPEKM